MGAARVWRVAPGLLPVDLQAPALAAAERVVPQGKAEAPRGPARVVASAGRAVLLLAAALAPEAQAVRPAVRSPTPDQ